MAISVDALVVGRVIGDVVDMFVPNGCDIKPSVANNPPRLTIFPQRRLNVLVLVHSLRRDFLHGRTSLVERIVISYLMWETVLIHYIEMLSKVSLIYQIKCTH